MKETNTLILSNIEFPKFGNSSTHLDNLDQKIVVMDNQECIFLNVKQICYIKGDGSYSNIYLQDGKKFTVSKNIKALTERLLEPIFYRIHKSYLVNINYIMKYVKSDGGYLVMENGVLIPVSSKMRDSLMSLVGIISL